MPGVLFGPRKSDVTCTSVVNRWPGATDDRVDGVRRRQRVAVFGDHELRQPVQVHRVDLQALVEVVDLDPVADVRDDGRGGGERLAVQRQADHAGVVQHHRHLLRDRAGVRRQRRRRRPGRCRACRWAPAPARRGASGTCRARASSPRSRRRTAFPGFTGAWVTSGTPSISNGTSSPWKWIAVDIGSLLSSTTRTWSPTFTLIDGPGTVPLKVHARTVLPGDTSQLASSAVRWNTFVPSAQHLRASSG